MSQQWPRSLKRRRTSDGAGALEALREHLEQQFGAIVHFPADLGASLRRDIPDYGDGKAGDKIARVIDEALALTSA